MMFVGLELDTVRVLHVGPSQKQSIQDPHREFFEALQQKIIDEFIAVRLQHNFISNALK